MNRVEKILIAMSIAIISLASCKDEVFLHDAFIENNGIIVGGVKRIWSIPLGTPTAYTDMSECIQFDDKAIMGGHLNGQGGLYCVVVETGEVVWWLPIVDGPIFVEVIRFIEEERALICYTEFLDSDKIHLRVNIDTGEVLWKRTLTHKGSPYAASDSCYYYTQYYPWENRVQATFKVNLATGNEELFYVTDLKPAPGYEDYAPNSYAAPFVYEGREYAFMFESRYDGNMGEFFTSLIDAATGEMLIKQRPISEYNVIDRADVYDGRIFAFTDNGYMEFDMEQLKFIPRTTDGYTGNYKNHRFYKGKLILSQSPYIDPGHPHKTRSLSVYDLQSNTLVFEYDDSTPQSLAILDDNLYITNGNYLDAYSLENGSMRMRLDFDGANLTDDVCTYKNSMGEMFVTCSDVRGIYCIQGI